MEEEKAAAYYDELTRKGGGAARFKQGLGFSSSSSGAASSTVDPPPRGSGLAASSFLSQFVKASNSGPAKLEEDKEKQKLQLESIQNKLRKKDSGSIESQFKEREREKDKANERDTERDRARDRERHWRRRNRSTEIERDRSRERRRRRRSRSRSFSSEERERGRERDRRRRRRRSRSRSFSDEHSKRKKYRRSGSRSRSLSPSYRRSEKGKEDREKGGRLVKKENDGVTDYGKLIEGYDEMAPAERVKAKMNLQLAETAAKDTKMGTGSGWERFDFNKDAPLDDEDEEIEGADDDAKIVKHLGQTFRFSNVQARREEEIKAAHDEAMFGAPAHPPSTTSEIVQESEKEKVQIESNEPATNLFSEKLLAKSHGSWRDRAPGNLV